MHSSHGIFQHNNHLSMCVLWERTGKTKVLFVFVLLNLLRRKDGCGVIVTIPTALSWGRRHGKYCTVAYEHRNRLSSCISLSAYFLSVKYNTYYLLFDGVLLSWVHCQNGLTEKLVYSCQYPSFFLTSGTPIFPSLANLMPIHDQHVPLSLILTGAPFPFKIHH